jgi:CheY-like chemotaxis protein
VPSLNRAVAPAPSVGLAGFPAVLIDRGLITRKDLSVAEPHAVREDLDLAEALVALGLASETDCYAALAAAAGAEVVALDTVTASELAVQLVPERLARRHFIVPLTVDNRTLTYATCRPFNAEAERDLGFASGRRTTLMVAKRSAVVNALDRYYPKLRYLDVLAERLREGCSSIEHADPASGKAAACIIDLCTAIIGRAVEVGASDVFIECGPQSGTIRYKVRGTIESMPALPATVSHPIRDRFKIMARVGSAIRNRAQNGTFRLTVNKQPIDVCLSTRPHVGGEQIMMQIMDNQSCVAVEQTVSARPKTPVRPRVLVTDDEPITRMLVKLLLEREHFDVLEATNGEQAVEIAMRERPDLLLIDLNMPIMDGYQAIHRLRGDASMAGLPIVVLTAEDDERVERRVLDLGANDYIIKPFEPAVLLARVSAVFNRLNIMAA